MDTKLCVEEMLAFAAWEYRLMVRVVMAAMDEQDRHDQTRRENEIPYTRCECDLCNHMRAYQHELTLNPHRIQNPKRKSRKTKTTTLRVRLPILIDEETDEDFRIATLNETLLACGCETEDRGIPINDPDGRLNGDPLGHVRIDGKWYYVEWDEEQCAKFGADYAESQHQKRSRKQ